MLVTGATGFLGRHVVARLRREPGVALTTLSRSPLETGGRHLVVDLAEPGPALGAFDAVIHLAAAVARGGTPESPATLLAGNVAATQSLLERLDPPPARFLLASTLDVYRPPRVGETVDEDAPLGPTGVYGATKLLAERLVAADAAARGYEAVTVRVGHLFGPGEEAYEKLIPVTIRRLLKGQPPTIVGSPAALRDLLYVGDAAEALTRLLAAPEPPPVLNLVAGTSVPIEEVIDTLCRIFGYVGPVRRLRDDEPGVSWRFDAARLHAALGAMPLTSLDDGLRAEVFALTGQERVLAGRPSG